MPRVLVLWMDALMVESRRRILVDNGDSAYIDVRLTSKPPGEMAFKPEITVK